MESNRTKPRKATLTATVNTQAPIQDSAPIRPHLAGGFDLKALPPDTLLDDSQTAAALGLKKGTLGVWRSTGRYALSYRKIGRRVFYTAGDLVEWLESRARLHTGEK